MAGNGAIPRSLKELPTTSLQAIVAAQYEAPDWLIDGILPQGCFLIVGRPKVGKSWLLLQLAVVIASGGKLFDHQAPTPSEVLYIAAEDDPTRIASRFKTYRVSEAPPNVKFLCRDGLAQYAAEFAEHYTLAEFIDLYLYENPTIRALIIDTESTVRAAWDGGSVQRDASLTRNDYAEVREFDEIAHRRRVFIALVNHTSKRKNEHWVDIHELINRTNTALAGASGSWVLADPPVGKAIRKDGCKVLGIRGRDIIEDQILAVRQNDCAIFESLGDYDDHAQTEAEREILEALEQLFKAEPEVWKTSKQIAIYLSRSMGSIQQAITRMVNRGGTRWKTYNIETRPKLGIRLIHRDTGGV